MGSKPSGLVPAGGAATACTPWLEPLWKGRECPRHATANHIAEEYAHFDYRLGDMVSVNAVGEGTIVWLTNKGAFGKSGKMEVSFDWLDLNGRRVSLTGTHRQEGEGNTGATVGAAVAVGVFSAFVTGRSATLVNGQQLRARTAEPLTFTVPADAARAYSGTLVPSTVAESSEAGSSE